MKYNWTTLIAHVDMDAFFASIEQMWDASLKEQPVVVTANPQSKTIIAASYEAKALGLKVGSRLQESSNVIIKHSSLAKYQELSQQIMNKLATLTPAMEVFSIDEAFLDFTGMENIYPDEETLINTIQSMILSSFGLTCSVGLSENKSLAKVASKVKKPHGSFIIPPNTGADYLSHKPVSTLCGIGDRMTKLLNQHGVINCGDIHKIPISLLSSRFGQIGRQVWHMCLGKGPTSLNLNHTLPKSMGNSACIKPDTYHYQDLYALIDPLCYKIAYRLRSQKLYAQSFTITLYQHKSKIQYHYKTETYTHYYDDIHQGALALSSLPWPLFITRIAIRTVDIQSTKHIDLLNSNSPHPEDVMDRVNQRFGSHALYLLANKAVNT